MPKDVTQSEPLERFLAKEYEYEADTEVEFIAERIVEVTELFGSTVREMGRVLLKYGVTSDLGKTINIEFHDDEAGTIIVTEFCSYEGGVSGLMENDLFCDTSTLWGAVPRTLAQTVIEWAPQT